MAILPIRFLSGAPWSGVQLVSSSVTAGTGSTTVADTATTSVLVPKPTCTTCQLVGFGFQARVAAISASGTVLAQLFKRDNSGTPADRTLTATKSIEADIIATADKAYPMPLTATAAQNVTFQSTDACRLDIVTTNTVGTQPTIVFVALWAIIKA